MESLWRKQVKDISSHNSNAKGTESNTRDVIVVGAGMAGLLIAYYLQKQGLDVLVLEANTIASGQTERTTAKITSQHGLKYHKMIQKVGLRKATLYAQANEVALAEYERLIQAEKIDCGFERVPAYLYTLQDPESLRGERDAAIKVGVDAFFTTNTELPFEVAGAVCFQRQAQFQPLEFVQAIAAQLEIWEHIKVLKVKGHRVITENAVLTADKIVLATHYPLRNVPGFYFLRQHQERSYVLALEGCDRIKGMYYGIDKEGLSFRQAGDVMLLGGSSRRTGHNKSGGAYDALVESAKQFFPNSQEVTRWAAQDCMPHDGIPFIGRYSIFTPHLYVATGFHKWGMTSAMIAAMILSDLLCGRENAYAEVFRPQRMNVRASIGSLLTDVGESVKGLAKGAFHKPVEKAISLPKGHGGIVTRDGERYACYCDEDGKLHSISARCPHMGCELAWNPDEKSWDCPCHGSRFDVDGKLLDNPANEEQI